MLEFKLHLVWNGKLTILTTAHKRQPFGELHTTETDVSYASLDAGFVES